MHLFIDADRQGFLMFYVRVGFVIPARLSLNREVYRAIPVYPRVPVATRPHGRSHIVDGCPCIS